MRLTPKLVLVLSFLSLDLLLATWAFLYMAERRHLEEESRGQRRAALERFAAATAGTFAPDDEPRRLAYLGMLLGSSPPGQVAEAMLLDTDGRVLLHTDFLKGDYSLRRRPTAELALQEAARAEEPLQRALGGGDRPLELDTQPVKRGGKRLATAAVLLDRDAAAAAIAALQRRTLGRFSGVFAAALAAGLAAAFLVARVLTAPILELEAGTRRVGAGDFAARVPDERQDELGDVARAFNAMAGRLGELDELKQGFLSRITHDLRNPLSAILGYVELILLGMQGPVEPRQRESLEVVVKNGSFLAELIDNILDITKLEAGKMELSPAEVPLAELAAEVLELARARAAEYRVELPAPLVAPGATLWGDPKALRRVLLNLVFNAIKFTPPGGRVWLEASDDKEGGDLVAVRDTGVGIPADKLGSLFKKFAQVPENQNKARPAKGTGLGLVICKELVEAHGGRVGVESREGQGSTFYFILPRRGAPAALPAPA